MAIKKGLSIYQAGRRVAKNKATVNHPGADYTMFPEGGKVDYTGMGIGFMNNRSNPSNETRIGQRVASFPINNKVYSDEWINDPETMRTILGMVNIVGELKALPSIGTYALKTIPTGKLPRRVYRGITSKAEVRPEELLNPRENNFENIPNAFTSSDVNTSESFSTPFLEANGILNTYNIKRPFAAVHAYDVQDYMNNKFKIGNYNAENTAQELRKLGIDAVYDQNMGESQFQFLNNDLLDLKESVVKKLNKYPISPENITRKRIREDGGIINDDEMDEYGKGGTIHIKKANRGKFNATKARTGKSTEELTHSKNAATRKRAIFAQNAAKWHHKADGGWIQEYADGGNLNIDSTLMANRNIPFVKKIYDKDTSSIQIPGVNGRSTHYMQQMDNFAYPTVQNVDGVLQYMGDKSYDNAMKTGNYIKFNNDQDALNFTENYKKSDAWKKYEQGGRTINPAMGGYAIGGRFAYPPMVPYPPEYGFGGVLQSFAPFLNLAVPGLGSAAGMVGGLLNQASDDKDQEELLMKQKQQQANRSQSGITGNAIPTFSWGGRLPETRLPMSPSGLTLGHVPGYDSNSNYGGTNVPGIPPKGWNYRMVKGKGEGTNWHRETNMNVHRHTYPVGGTVGKAVTTVHQNRFIPVTEQQFYQQAIQPYNDTLSYDQFNQLPATLADRSKYLPNSDWKIEQGKKGSTMNRGYLKYYQNNPKDMGTDMTIDGLPVFKQPSQIEIQKQFPTHSMYPMGGQINDNLEMQPVELEKQEVYQTPSGQMGQVNGPSHAEGGVDMELPENSFVWSDKLKTAKGTTFADEAAKLGRLKAKYEKILKA